MTPVASKRFFSSTLDASKKSHKKRSRRYKIQNTPDDKTYISSSYFPTRPFDNDMETYTVNIAQKAHIFLLEAIC